MKASDRSFIHSIARAIGKPPPPCFSRRWEEPPSMPTTLAGRHFLQTPGPTNLPDRVLRAMDRNAINHRGPEFGALGREVVAKLRRVLPDRTHHRHFPGLRYRRLGSRRLTNTLVARRPRPDQPHRPVLPSVGADGGRASARLVSWKPTGAAVPTRSPSARCWRTGSRARIKAVCAVHSETSTSCMTDIAARARRR